MLAHFAMAMVLVSAACKQSSSSTASTAGIDAHWVTEFFEEFRFEPLPITEDTSEIAVPWVVETAPGSSGTFISPLTHDPERELRMVFKKIAKGEPSTLDSFWNMLQESVPTSEGYSITWKRHQELPHFAYGTYPAGDGRIGRIWISLASNDAFDRVELHLRMVEQDKLQ